MGRETAGGGPTFPEEPPPDHNRNRDRPDQRAFAVSRIPRLGIGDADAGPQQLALEVGGLPEAPATAGAPRPGGRRRRWLVAVEVCPRCRDPHVHYVEDSGALLAGRLERRCATTGAAYRVRPGRVVVNGGVVRRGAS